MLVSAHGLRGGKEFWVVLAFADEEAFDGVRGKDSQSRLVSLWVEG